MGLLRFSTLKNSTKTLIPVLMPSTAHPAPGQATLTYATSPDITATFKGTEFSVNNPPNLNFINDGTKLYVSGDFGDDVNE